MILLDTTTRALKAKLSGAASVTNPMAYCSYDDLVPGTPTITPGATGIVLNGVTAVVLAAAPAASTYRQIKGLWIRNDDTAAVTATLYIDDSGTQRNLW